MTMVETLLTLDRVVAIAHRGGSTLHPENTFAAFDWARDCGVDALECDVHLSRDGDVVVIHDPTVDRTTDGTGEVCALTSAELARLDAGFQFGPDRGYPFRHQGIGVPRLGDLLARYPDLPVIIEIKGERPLVGERTLDVVREAGAADRVIIGGFSQVVLDAVRRRAPEVATGATQREARAALTRAYVGLGPWRAPFRVLQMPFWLNGRQIFRRSFVRAVRRGKRPVHAWIVNEPDQMRRLIAWGVTGIISDRPDVAVEEVRRAKESLGH